MGMPSHPRSKTLVIWIVLISILYLAASCGDDQEKTDKTADVAEKVPQTQQPIVKEWYPRPKYPPPTAYVPAPGPSVPSTGQPQSYYPGTYQQPQMTEQMSTQSSPWNQSGQSQGMPQQFQTGPQHQTQQRPWGEFPPLEKKKKSTTRQEQRPVTIPYGGWPSYGGYGGYPAYGGYGGYPGYGGYGYGLSDPLLGTPGGAGIYSAYPEMIPPLYGW
jgi:hypothetical protein